MNFIFIISAKFLVLLSLLSCGGESGSSSSDSSSRAPRYRALLVDAEGTMRGTAILRENESEIQTEVHVVSGSLRRSLKQSLVLTGPCPPSGELPAPESVLHDLGRGQVSSIEFGSTPPGLAGHSILLSSSEDPLACGPLVPIPQE